MGRLIEQIAIERGHEIVSIIDVNNTADFDSPSFASADVAIEFTTPTSAFDNFKKAFEHNVKVVSGSTGWEDEHVDEVERLCSYGGKTLFWASNFSLGVAIFDALNRHLARIMNEYPGYTPRMEETHHIHKLDAPSGTAITLAEGIVGELDRIHGWKKGTFAAPDGSVSGSAESEDGVLSIDSVRRDEVPGIHTVTYESEADRISITHDAHNRQGFALGAVLAAEYTKDHTGLLTMSDLFRFG